MNKRTILTFSHKAMATIFQIFVRHGDRDYAAQAAQAAFAEADRLEQELSRFLPNSDISRINRLKKGQKITVGLDTFECLKQCQRLYKETDGLFDVTVGPLMDCWQRPDKSLRTPTPEALAEARSRVGMHLLKLDENTFTVTVATDNIQVDLGGYGKGYAIDQMAKILEEWEITEALLHSGASSARALHGDWPVTISLPGKHDIILQKILLRKSALNGSGTEKGRHIINPISGIPETRQRAAWAKTATAAYGDALSTSFMLMDRDKIDAFCRRHPEVGALVIPIDGTQEPISLGKWP